MGFNEDQNDKQRRTELDTIQEDKEMALIRTEVVKQRIMTKNNGKVVGQKFSESNIVLRRANKHPIEGKLALK